MCWCFNFGFSSKQKHKDSSSSEKKRRDKPDDALRGDGKPVAAEVSEKRRSSETHRKRRSGESETPRSPRREREEQRPRSRRYEDDTYQRRDDYQPSLNVQVPETRQRAAEQPSASSSREALLNPRPHRSQHQRQRHPKRTSQTTLRGRGAKRDPPRHSKSKKNLRPEPSRGWSFFAPSPPKTPKRSRRDYSTLDSSPRSTRSSRHHRSPHATSDSSRSQTRQRTSRQHERQTPRARSPTPNTAARRVPDRRFAVRAATNNALEEVRREAFAQPSPPPRRERIRRYEGVTIPTSQVPFNWDCMSSSQTSAGYGTTAGEPSSRTRRSRR
jgi:hypothetical protein